MRPLSEPREDFSSLPNQNPGNESHLSVHNEASHLSRSTKRGIPHSMGPKISDSHRRLELKEVLNLVSLHATTSSGRLRIANQEPFESAEEVREGLAEVAEIRLRLNSGLDLLLRGLGDLGTILATEAGGKNALLDGIHLANVARVLDRARALREALDDPEFPRLSHRARQLVDLPTLRERLEQTIDSSGELLDEASEALLDLRLQAGVQEEEIRQWLEKNRELSPWKKFLQGPVITPRNGRLCWAVRLECRHQVRGVIHGESASGQTLFVEPEPMVRKGHQLQKIHDKIVQEQRRIIAELCREIWAKSGKIVALWDHLVKLDIAQAKALFADNFGCQVPEISDHRELVLHEARHPLLIWREIQDRNRKINLPEKVSEEVLTGALEAITPLSLHLHSQQFQLVVTGPNTGGKTVVLKTAGVLALMASCAIPVPADETSQIPCFDAIHVDIGDEQSVLQDLSTFSSHVAIVSQILKCATSKSLVLLDELGSGTDPLEGAALAEAVLDRLYQRGVLTVVTTHIGRLKEYAYRRKKCENAAMEFDPIKLAPTYRLKVGLPGRSNALVIAERLGMPEDVVDAAREHSERETGLDPEVIEGLRRSQSELDRKVERGRESRVKRRRVLAQEVEQTELEQR